MRAHLPKFLARILHQEKSEIGPSLPLAVNVELYLISQKRTLGNPTMSGAREDGLFAATYYNGTPDNQTIDQFVAALRQLSTHPGMESFEVLLPTHLSNGSRPVYSVPVRFAPVRQGGPAAPEELGILVTYHWKK